MTEQQYTDFTVIVNLYSGSTSSPNNVQPNDVKNVLSHLYNLCLGQYKFSDFSILEKAIHLIYVYATGCYWFGNPGYAYIPAHIILVTDYLINNYLDNIPKYSHYIIGLICGNPLSAIVKKKEICDNILHYIKCLGVCNRYGNHYYTFPHMINLLIQNKIQFNIDDTNITVFMPYYTQFKNIILNYYADKTKYPTEKVLMCAAARTNIDFVKEMLLLGGKLTTKVLESACESGDLNKNLINFILDSHIDANDKCISNYIKSLSNPHGHVKKKSNVTSTEEWQNTIDRLIVCGGKLTYDNVVTLVTKHRKLENIEKYNITFAKNFSTVCAKADFYPYPEHIIPTLEQLEAECAKYGNLAQVRTLVDVHGIKPSGKCLENACMNKSCTPILNYLIDTHKVCPTFRCLENISEVLGHSAVEKIVSALKISYENMVNELEKAHENSKKNCDDKKDGDDKKNCDDKKDGDIKKNSDIKKDGDDKNTKGSDVDKEDYLISTDDSNLSDLTDTSNSDDKNSFLNTPKNSNDNKKIKSKLESSTSCKSSKKTKKIKIKRKTKLETDDKTSEKSPKIKTKKIKKQPKINDVDILNSNNLPEKQKMLQVMPQDFDFITDRVIKSAIKKDLDINTDKCNFISFRKNVMNYIKTSKLLKNKNIHINNILSAHLNIDEKCNEIPFSELDNLAYNLFI